MSATAPGSRHNSAGLVLGAFTFKVLGLGGMAICVAAVSALASRAGYDRAVLAASAVLGGADHGAM